MSATLAAAAFIIALAGQDAPPVVQDPPAAPPPRKLELTFDMQGRVTLIAQQVTVSEILAEWSRKGGTRIQGGEQLAGGPIQVPLRFENRPELEVIEALTRQAAGISIAPRLVGAAGASRFESIHIVATSNATASNPYPSAPYTGTSAPPIRGFPNDEIAPVVAPGARDAQPPAQPQQPGARPNPTAPAGSPVIVPVVPVVPVGGAPTTPPAGGRGGGGGTPPTTTTGRGGGGGGR